MNTALFPAALLAIGVKSILVAVATLALLRLAARRSAAERSAIAHLGLCALLALPLAGVLVPPLSVLVPGHLAVEVLQVPASTVPASILPGFAPSTVPSASPAAGAGALVLCAYLAPALSLLLLMCAALARLGRLRATARPVTDALWCAAFARVQRRMGFANGPALLAGGPMSSPISWGLIRPAILLNEEMPAKGPQAEAILAHELAHVIHHDWAKLILARLATAAFWFNPLAWILARAAHQLREESADDAVLAAGIAGPDYAALLVDAARCETRYAPLAVHGMALRRSSLHGRITRILDDAAVRTVPGRNQLAALTAATLAVAVPLAALKLAPAAVPAARVPHAVASAVIAAAPLFIPARAPAVPAPAASPPTPVVNSVPAAQKRSPDQPATPASVPAKRAASAAVVSRPTAPPARATAQPEAGALQQQAGIDQYPQVLRGTLDAECFSGGGTPGQSPNLFRTADFNDDGIPDIVFDRMNYECRGAAIGRGRYGTTLTIFIGGPSHSVAEVYTGAFYGSWVDYGRDGKASLIVADAADCGTPDAAGTSITGWESCGHRVALHAPAQSSAPGPEPISDKAEDR